MYKGFDLSILQPLMTGTRAESISTAECLGRLSCPQPRRLGQIKFFQGTLQKNYTT